MRWLGFIALAFGLLACQAAGGEATSAPERVITRYLEARVRGDVDAMVRLSCADWELRARNEAASLRNVEVKLEGLQCATTTREAAQALVRCTGKIVANYNGELRDFDLSLRDFRLVQQGGEWLMCGYSE